MKRLFAAVAKLVAILFLSFAAYVVWSIVREGEAKENVHAFCGRFPVGTPMADVAKAALAEGEPRYRRITDDRISVAYVGAYPFSRHFCLVEGQGGKVVSVRISHLD